MWRGLYNHYRLNARKKLIILIDEEKRPDNEETDEIGVNNIFEFFVS
jgi:hypothetical protein